MIGCDTYAYKSCNIPLQLLQDVYSLVQDNQLPALSYFHPKKEKLFRLNKIATCE